MDIKLTKQPYWQEDEKCDMLYMLICLRDDVWHSMKLKEEQKLKYISEAVPAILTLMKEVKEEEPSKQNTETPMFHDLARRLEAYKKVNSDLPTTHDNNEVEQG